MYLCAPCSTYTLSLHDALPIFAPALAAISLRTRELVHLGRLEGTEVVYLDKVEPERTLRVWSRVGSRAPAARTSLGRADRKSTRLNSSHVATSYAVSCLNKNRQ